MKKNVIILSCILGLIFGFNTVKSQNIVVDSLLVLVPANLDTTGFNNGLQIIKNQWENEVLRYGSPSLSNIRLNWKVEVLPIDSYFDYDKDVEMLGIVDTLLNRAFPWTYVTYLIDDTTNERSFTSRQENNKIVGFWEQELITEVSHYMAVHEMGHGFAHAKDYVSNPLRIWDPITDPDQTHLKRSLMSYGPYPTIPYFSPAHIDSTLKYYIPRGGVVSMNAVISPVTPEMEETLNIHDSLNFCWEPIYAAKRYHIYLFEDGVSAKVVDTTVSAYSFDEAERLITFNRCLTISATVLKPNTNYTWKVVGENDYTIGLQQNVFSFSISQLTDVE